MAIKAKQIDFLLSQVRNSVGSLAGGKIYFYSAGTNTLKTIWLDRNKASPAANPYTLDANGKAQLYADGLYKIVIKNASGRIIYTHDYLEFVSYGEEGYLVTDYTSINAAVTAIGATKTTLLVTNAQTLTGNLTTPSTLTLKILQGGSVVKASTYTLTINGPFEAGLYQVFFDFSAEDITFGNSSVKEIYSEWFSSLYLANATAYNSGKLLVISQNYTLATTPEANPKETRFTADILIKPGGGFTKVSDFILRFNGIFHNPGLIQVFWDFVPGTWDIAFNKLVKEVYPQWFGAKADGVTDDTVALHNSRDCIAQNNTIMFTPGTYLVSSLTWNRSMNMMGTGQWVGSAIIKSDTPGVPVIAFGPGAISHIKISNLKIEANVDSTACVTTAKPAGGFEFNRVFFKGNNCPSAIITQGYDYLSLRDIYTTGFSDVNIKNTGTYRVFLIGGMHDLATNGFYQIDDADTHVYIRDTYVESAAAGDIIRINDEAHQANIRIDNLVLSFSAANANVIHDITDGYVLPKLSICDISYNPGLFQPAYLYKAESGAGDDIAWSRATDGWFSMGNSLFLGRVGITSDDEVLAMRNVVAAGNPINYFFFDSDNNFRRHTAVPTAGTDGNIIPMVQIKTTTGNPTGIDGLICINTSDNTIRMYADGGWRTLVSW